MKIKTIIIAAMLALLGGSAAASEADRQAQEADELYRQNDFAAAAERYEEVLASGYGSAEMHYNLGNAYFRTGEWAKSILNYERALRLRPGMGEAKENLALAESKTVDRIAELPRWFGARWVDSLCWAMRPSGWRAVWLAVLAVLAAAVVGLRLGKTTGQRKAGLATGLAMLVVLLVVSAMWHGSAVRYNTHREAIVMQPAMAVKGSPDEMGVDKMVVHEGTKVRVVESLNGWHKIALADGSTGWCANDAIERI